MQGSRGDGKGNFEESRNQEVMAYIPLAWPTYGQNFFVPIKYHDREMIDAGSSAAKWVFHYSPLSRPRLPEGLSQILMIKIK